MSIDAGLLGTKKDANVAAQGVNNKCCTLKPFQKKTEENLLPASVLQNENVQYNFPRSNGSISYCKTRATFYNRNRVMSFSKDGLIQMCDMI